MKRIDLNVDIGEGFPFDRELLDFATSANIACGEHAGSWELTLETIDVCVQKGIRIGMHPGFPDRASMGRATPEFRQDYFESLVHQADRFMAAHAAAYVKPHGAWYNGLFQRPPTYLVPLEEIMARYPVEVMLLPAGPISEAWPDRLIREGFADRGYRDDGTLIPRGQPLAVLEDPREIRAQVLRLAERVDSICLHGDTPGCLEFAALVRGTLEHAGYQVGP